MGDGTHLPFAQSSSLQSACVSKWTSPMCRPWFRIISDGTSPPCGFSAVGGDKDGERVATDSAWLEGLPVRCAIQIVGRGDLAEWGLRQRGHYSKAQGSLAQDRTGEGTFT